MTSRSATHRRPAPPPAPRAAPPSRTVVVVAATVAFLLVLVLGIALATGGGDAADDGVDGVAPFGPVAVDGAPLAVYDEPDRAVGALAPNVLGRTPSGGPIEIGLGAPEPTLVVFLAHWCPHCQAELPVLVRLAEEGAFEGVRVVAVLTATNPDAPNYPPVAWLEREGWTGEVLLDDEASSAGTAYGEAGYPFLVALDTDGRVVARTAGEQPAEVVRAMVAAAG